MKYKVTVNGKSYEVLVEKSNATVLGVTADAPAQAAAPAAAKVAQPAPSPAANGGDPVNAPMPGTINDIKVAIGDNVKAGQVLLILEAMKMENEIVAPKNGKVVSISVTKGSSVSAGTRLMGLE